MQTFTKIKKGETTHKVHVHEIKISSIRTGKWELRIPQVRKWGYTYWMLSQIIFIQHSEINTNMTLRQLCVWNDHTSEWWIKRQNYLLFANIKLPHKILQQKCNFISSLLLFHKMLLYWNLNLVIVDFLSFIGTHWMRKCCISLLQCTW